MNKKLQMLPTRIFRESPFKALKILGVALGAFFVSNSRFEDYLKIKQQSSPPSQRGVGGGFPVIIYFPNKITTTPPYRASPPSQGRGAFCSIKVHNFPNRELLVFCFSLLLLFPMKYRG